MESKHPIQLELPLTGKPKILVVEDDADSRDMLKTFFSAHGYDVLTAGDGQEALAAVYLDSQIDIILLDVVLPLTGGLEVLKEIQALASAPSVILITGLDDKEIA